MKTVGLAVSVFFACSQFAVGQIAEINGASDFYRAEQVQVIHLRVAKEDRERLVAALPKRIFVPASFQWRDVVYEKVAIRFKGNSSANPHQRHKRSFLIKFDKYDKSGQFLGLRRVSFDNGVQFGSLFSEPIITEILRDQGIKTHRCNFAKIFLNDEYQGVYVNVERIDESFIERELSADIGALYKVDEGGPGCNLQFLGNNPDAYSKTFEAKTDDAKEARDRLIDFIKLIHETSGDETSGDDFAAQIESKFELDDFLRVTAVMLFSGAFDQLTGWNPHNYYLYNDTQKDRWRYLPWDLDVGFSETAFGRIHVLEDWNAAWPVAPSGPNPLLERIVADPQLLQRYRRIAQTILKESFEPERLCGVVDAKYALIKDDLQADPFPHRRVTSPQDRNYDDIIASIKTFIRKRYASAVEQLENPGDERPTPVRRASMPAGGTPPPRLAIKIRRVQQRAQKLEQEMRAVHELMRRVGALLEAGKVDEAEKVLDSVE